MEPVTLVHRDCVLTTWASGQGPTKIPSITSALRDPPRQLPQNTLIPFLWVVLFPDQGPLEVLPCVWLLHLLIEN